MEVVVAVVMRGRGMGRGRLIRCGYVDKHPREKRRD
jgi:hypothetical protein